MPNWCDNALVVTGPPERLADFQHRAKSGSEPLNLERLVPCPNGEWTPDWCRENWGTRGDLDGAVVHHGAGRLRYVFCSAWSPPERWLATVAPAFPELAFRLYFSEEGAGFAGHVYYLEGAMLEEENTDYPTPTVFKALGMTVVYDSFDNGIELLRCPDTSGSQWHYLLRVREDKELVLPEHIFYTSEGLDELPDSDVGALAEFSPAQDETFLRLAEDWHGTIADLVQAVLAVVPTTGDAR